MRDIKSECDFFTIEKITHTVIIHFNDCPLFCGLDLNLKGSFLDCLDDISKDENIRTVLLFGPPSQKGCERFFHACQKKQTPINENYPFKRLQTAINQYVTKIINLNKIVVHVEQRNSIPLFMDLGLACDYKIICDDAFFHLQNIELGLLPRGGEIFILNKMLGYKKALSIFLFEEKISAKGAFDIGLVDRVVPFNKLKDAAFQIADEISKKPSYIIAGIKRMLNRCNQGLQSYMEYENKVYSKIVHTKNFHEKIKLYSWGQTCKMHDKLR